MNNYVSLKDFIYKQISGDWGKEKSDEKYNSEVFCIRCADINAVNEGNYNDLPIRYIESRNKAKFLNEGNIIIEISGGSPTQSTGRACYVRGVHANIICSNFCRAYEIKQEHSPKFFYYLVKNIYNSNIFFNFESKTTGIKNLLLDVAFENIKVPTTSLSTQKFIAKVLSDLDAKIEINNRINRELEAMTKTLYDYWFVQFDFPDEKGKPYKSSGGKMIYNKELKREIPEGWEMKELSDIANITMGQSPSGSSYNDDENGEIFFQGSTDFGWRYPTIRQYTTEPSRMAQIGDVLLSVRAPVGTLNIADNKCCIGRGLAALNSKFGYDSYLYYVMENFKQIFDHRNNAGTTFGSITKDDLFSLKLVYPKDEVLKKYNYSVAKYNQTILNNY